VVAGLAGHQRIGPPATIEWLRQQIRATVKNHQVAKGVVSLAIGADQLFAAVLLELGVPYLVVLPCALYADTFSKTDLPKYQYFLQRASAIQELPFQKPSESAFYEAGKTVVQGSDLIIAVWDGEPSRGLGGTADIVNYAENIHKPIVHIDPIRFTVQLR